MTEKIGYPKARLRLLGEKETLSGTVIYARLKHKKCGLGEDEDFKALRNLLEMCATLIRSQRMPPHKMGERGSPMKGSKCLES